VLSMEADWDELAIAQLPSPGPHLPAVPVSTFAFDTSQELLWTGNNHVRRTSSIMLNTCLLTPVGRAELHPFTGLTSSDIRRIAGMRLPTGL